MISFIIFVEMIVPYSIVNKDGKEVQFFTHSNYLAQEKLQAINQGIQSRKSACTYVGFVGAIASYFVFVF